MPKNGFLRKVSGRFAHFSFRPRVVLPTFLFLLSRLANFPVKETIKLLSSYSNHLRLQVGG